MTLLLRMARLFKADVHGLLDCLEEPEAVLKQAVREMEAEIEKGEQALADLGRRAAQLDQVIEDLRASLAEYDSQVDLCFEEGNHDLARSFLRKKLEAEKRLKGASSAADALTAEKEAAEQKISQQREQLSAIVEKMRLWGGSRTQWSCYDPVASCASSQSAVSDEEVEMAFLHEKRKRAGGTTQGSPPQ